MYEPRYVVRVADMPQSLHLFKDQIYIYIDLFLQAKFSHRLALNAGSGRFSLEDEESLRLQDHQEDEFKKMRSLLAMLRKMEAVVYHYDKSYISPLSRQDEDEHPSSSDEEENESLS